MAINFTCILILISLMVGFMTFPIIFSFNLPPQAGPGLVFKTLPVLFSQLPGSLLISTTFFVLFVFTALTSSVALVEVVVANFIDLFGWTRKKAALIVGSACFIFGIPSALSISGPLFANWPAIYGKTFFKTVDDLVTDWFLPVCGFLTALYVGWFLDREQALEEFASGTKFRYLFKPWLFFMKWIAPTAIFLIILSKSGVNLDSLFR